MPLSVPLLIKNEYPSPHVITWIKYYHYMKIIQKLLLNDIQGQINIYKELDIKRSNGYKLLRELIDLNYIKEDSDYIKGKGHIYSFSFMKIFNDDYSDLKELNKYTNYDYSQPNINPIVKELNDNKKFLSKSEFYIP